MRLFLRGDSEDQPAKDQPASSLPAPSWDCWGAARRSLDALYRLVEPPDQDAARVLKDTLSWRANDREMQRDRERLVKVCCAPQLPVSIQDAPRPASLVDPS